MKKKIVILVLLVFVAATLIACRNSSVNSKTSDSISTAKADNLPAKKAVDEPVKASTDAPLRTIGISAPTQAMPKAGEKPADKPSAEATVGTADGNVFCSSEANGFKVEILSVERSKDYLGTDCVQVKYNFTNNSGSTRDFQSTVSTQASQNGRPLNIETPVVDYSIMAAQAQPVADGQSLEVICFFPVQNYNDSLDLSIGIFKGNPVVEILSEASCTVSIPA